MAKQPYASFRNIIAAGDIWKLPVFGTSFRVLYNSLVTNPQVSVDNAGSFYEIASGLGPKGLTPFSQLEFRNPAGAAMELWVGVAFGEIDDARATFSEEIAVVDISNTLVSGTSIIALPRSGILINNAAAIDKGGGKVGIPCTGQPFTAGETVTIAGTINYNGDEVVDATSTANEVVITAAYVPEVFTGAETINLTTPRSIATSATRKALDIHNHDAAIDLWYGDSTVSPASYLGVPITSGNGLWLPSTAQIYFAAPVAAGKTGVRLSYNSHTKT